MLRLVVVLHYVVLGLISISRIRAFTCPSVRSRRPLPPHRLLDSHQRTILESTSSSTTTSSSSNSNSDCNSNNPTNATPTNRYTNTGLHAVVTHSIMDHGRYAAYWDNLLLEDYDHQTKDLRERRSKWSSSRLESMGISILDALAEPDSDMLGEKIIRISKYGDKNANLQDKFARGDVLLMTCLRPDIDALPKESLVVDVGKDWITVGVGSSWPKGLWETRKLPGYYPVRLDRTAPKSPLKAQRIALEHLRKGQGGTIVDFLVRSLPRNDDTSQPQSNAFAKSQTPQPNNSNNRNHNNKVGTSHEESILRESLNEVLPATTFKPNESQRDAIVWALQRNVSLIRGPPGTGKTRVAALLVSTYLKYTEQVSSDEKPGRVLAVTHSNGAADVLLEGLLQMGVPAVRIGRPASVSADVQHRTVVAMAERHPEVKRIRMKARDMTLEPHERTVAQYEIRRRVMEVQKSIVQTAPVVVASCIGAQQLLEQGQSDCTFPLVVLDEAAQTTEPALVCALVAARAKQLVMVGDTRQLPPTVSAGTLRQTLGVSPMARLEKMGFDQHTLSVQYRMVPSLLEHPSKYFYNGLVQCATGTDIGEDDDDDDDDVAEVVPPIPPNGFPWPNENRQHIAFVQVGPDKEITHSLGGKSNPTEADLVVRMVRQLLSSMSQDNPLDATDIAVISPYSKQVQRIRNELALHRLGNVRVGTVDSFQGQETDVVIFSCVRSNLFAQLGFLQDPRRLCVAITRARRGLIVVGDEPVLRSNHHWSALMDSLSVRNCIMPSSDVEEFMERSMLMDDSPTSLLSSVAGGMAAVKDDGSFDSAEGRASLIANILAELTDGSGDGGGSKQGDGMDEFSALFEAS